MRGEGFVLLTIIYVVEAAPPHEQILKAQHAMLWLAIFVQRLRPPAFTIINSCVMPTS